MLNEELKGSHSDPEPCINYWARWRLQSTSVVAALINYSAGAGVGAVCVQGAAWHLGWPRAPRAAMTSAGLGREAGILSGSGCSLCLMDGDGVSRVSSRE